MQSITETSNNPDLIKFEQSLTKMLRGIAGKLGTDYLKALVQVLCETLELDFAIIGRWHDKNESRLKTLAVFGNGKTQENFLYKLSDTPCKITKSEGLCCVSEKVQQLFPDNLLAKRLNADGYLGVILTDSKNNKIGVLETYTLCPLKNIALITSIFQIFAYRVSSELERQAIIQDLRSEVSINQALLDSVPALTFMINRKGRFQRWNQYFMTKFGYGRNNMLEQDILTSVSQEDRIRVELEITNIFKSGKGSLYLNGITKDGVVVPLLATMETCEYEGEPVLVGVALDMTEQQTVEHNLLRSQGRLARKNSQLSLINQLVEKLHASRSVKHIADEVVHILKTIEDGASIIFSIVEISTESMRIIASSGASQKILKTRTQFSIFKKGSPTALAVRSKKLEVFKTFRGNPKLSPDIIELIESENVKCGLVIPLVYQNKALGAITIGFRYQSDFPDDEIEFFKTIGSSISLALTNARQFELMEKLATHDNLTGLPNRNALNADSLIALEENNRSSDCLGLILIDLDRFKEINDTLDHQIGDKLLKLLGPRIKHAVNDDDTRLYRLGGDEFCLLVTKKKNAAEIASIAEVINKAIERVFVIDGLNLEISSSIGVVTTKGDRYNPNELLRCVELAMYHAKNNGGGIAHYRPELDADTEQRFVIMAEMAEAIRNDDLVLHYQPKFDLKTQKITGCEALVRWQHKKYGLLPPDKFIPLIELTQLIEPLTYWVMEKAFSQLQKWKNTGIKISVAINLSTRNLTDKKFIKQVDLLIEKYQLEANEIEFELTETALINNLTLASKQLDKFKQRHINCSLDDYGTGYSSLSYVKKLPLDILKIDSSFITKMMDDKADSIIAKSTIDLAHNLGMKVIAEGVEDQSTMLALIEQGCDMVQGYYICEPVDADKFSELYWEYSESQ